MQTDGQADWMWVGKSWRHLGLRCVFLEQWQNSSLLQLRRKYARFQGQVAYVTDDWGRSLWTDSMAVSVEWKGLYAD